MKIAHDGIMVMFGIDDVASSGYVFGCLIYDICEWNE
jgi:hypothetical protein